MTSLVSLLTEVRACTVCAEHLPLGPRPIVQVHPAARILIAGQAPGSRVHETGIPFNDASGERLRSWLGMSREVFYDPRQSQSCQWASASQARVGPETFLHGPNVRQPGELRFSRA